tara:strand:- start:192 stop:443 length:252 start_codon:yes stop_codon:yes gene_type:complete
MKNLEGSYFSIYGFVGRNELEKKAENTFGKNWESAVPDAITLNCVDDIDRIQKICDSIEDGRYLVYIDENNLDNILVREDDNL